MRKDELQYIADSHLIDNLVSLQFGLQKQAGVSDILGGVGSEIKSFVQEHVSEDKPGGVIGSLLNIMAPAVIFRIHPIMGILYLIATAFGFDLQSTLGKIIDTIKPKLESGEAVTTAEVNAIGASLAGGITAESSDDLLGYLHKLDLNKFAGPSSYSQQDIMSKLFGGTGQASGVKVPWLFADKNAGPLQRIFGNLFASGGKNTARRLLVGFMVWIVKTILAGAGLLAVTGFVANKLRPNAESTPTTNSEPKSESITTGIPSTLPAEQIVPNLLNDLLNFTGAGQKIVRKSPSALWVVPLSGSIENTLLNWVNEMYPNMSEYEDIIMSTPSFQSMIDKLNDPAKVGANSLVIPQEFQTRKDIVDTFIRDAAKKVVNKGK